MIQALTLATLWSFASSHMWVVDPPARAHKYVKGSAAGGAGSCPYGICFWFSQGCTIGCPQCGGYKGSATCFGRQGAATLPDYARTQFFNGPAFPKGACGLNPWCAPGSAPVMNPCGVAGGDIIPGGISKGGNPPYKIKGGTKGTDLSELPGPKKVWKAGATVDVQWAMIANHGGGYQYRLCPKNAVGGVTEACFQKTPLKFAGNKQWVQWVPPPEGKKYPAYSPTSLSPLQIPNLPYPDPQNRTEIPMVTVNTGTVPSGSTWARNPVPFCRTTDGGAFGHDQNCVGNAAGFQFKPPIEDKMRPGHLLGGFGAATCYGKAPSFPASCGVPVTPGNNAKLWDHMLQFNIVDKLIVPDVPPGEYIISGRWDCEQTAQVWSMCFDVTIEGGGPSPPAPTPPKPTPTPAPTPPAPTPPAPTPPGPTPPGPTPPGPTPPKPTCRTPDVTDDCWKSMGDSCTEAGGEGCLLCLASPATIAKTKAAGCPQTPPGKVARCFCSSHLEETIV